MSNVQRAIELSKRILELQADERQINQRLADLQSADVSDDEYNRQADEFDAAREAYYESSRSVTDELSAITPLLSAEDKAAVKAAIRG